jgi:hypothetical protein
MKRIISVFVVAAVTVAMVATTALPAMAAQPHFCQYESYGGVCGPGGPAAE